MIATVRLRSTAHREAVTAAIEQHAERYTGTHPPEELIEELRARDRLAVVVRLAAEDNGGRLIESASDDFSASFHRRGVAALWHRYRGPRLSEDPDEETEILQRTYRLGVSDIEDCVNQMLGRDPDQHTPPHLAWGNLITALERAGITANEEQLIATPLTVELDDKLEAELAAA